jgi:hypothetical protein
MTKPRDPKRRPLLRVLDRVERVGNALPHPATLFALLALVVVLLSWVCTRLGIQATHPGTGELVVARNLVSGEGVRWLFESVEKNFVRFPPLGLVLTVMVGIGVAEGSGLLTALIRFLVLRAPRRLITMAVVFAGIFSHVASEAGYVVLIPLAAAMFLALGRHPMAGLAAAFSGVSGGFGANFVITSVDPVLAGMSESAAQILDGGDGQPGGQPLLHGSRPSSSPPPGPGSPGESSSRAPGPTPAPAPRAAGKPGPASVAASSAALGSPRWWRCGHLTPEAACPETGGPARRPSSAA